MFFLRIKPMSSFLVQAPKKHFCLILAILVPFKVSCKKCEKACFDQRLKCTAPKILVEIHNTCSSTAKKLKFVLDLSGTCEKGWKNIPYKVPRRTNANFVEI